MSVSSAKCFSAPLHHELYYNAFAQTSTMANHEREMVESPAQTKRISRNCTALVMNSTVRDNKLGAESREAMSCELSTINNSLIPLKRVTDTPAKVFARLKAKVQQQNSEELRQLNDISRQLGRSVSLSKNMQPHVDGSPSEQQHIYVLTLSPPKSTINISELEDPQMTSQLDSEEPVIALEKMLNETVTQVKMQQRTTGTNRTSKSIDINQAYVLLERMPEYFPAQPGPAKPLQLMNNVKNRSYHGVFGEISVRDDSAGEVDDDSNRVDTLQRLNISAQSQREPQRSKEMSKRQCESLEAPPQTLPNLLEDSLLQLSPRICIPRKQMAIVKSKQQTKDISEAQDGRTNVNGIQLRDWVLKLHNRELIVDGIRIDNNIPWHSSCITERVSRNLVKTASGGTYFLIGKMSHYHCSSFPSWFRKKFLFGFPEMWKEYLNKFLTDNEGSGKNQQRNNSAPCEPQKNLSSKKQITQKLMLKDPVTPVSSARSEQSHSAPVSRSGRLIKPPLEYWKGGRITVGPDMNVTVHDDYTSTSILFTPKTRPVVLLKSQKMPKEHPVSPEIQKSSDEDTLATRRRVKQLKSWKTEEPETWGNVLQNKVLISDSGSEKAAAKRFSPQQSQSERMYLRRGRSYSRERNSTGSELKFDDVFCAEDSAIQAPRQKIKMQPSQKHLQRVIQNEKHISDSDTSSSQSEVQKSADLNQLFTPPDPIKVCRRKNLKQKGKLVPLIAAMSETEDSDFSMPQDKMTGKKNTQRQRKVPQKYENCVITDVGNKSPSLKPRKYKSKNSKSSLKRTKPRNSSEASERTKDKILEVDKYPEQSEKTDNPQPFMPDNVGRNPKSSVKTKISSRNNKEQTANNPETEQDALKAWTDKELQKLNEAVNTFPKHKRGYWVNVSLLVGTRSAEECQKQFTALYQRHGRSIGKHKAKTSKTDKPAKETALITAKVGTLKRKKQMWDFLDRMPRDDHDDVFAGSPMCSKQIKLPVWSTNGDEPDFGHLQNPQTPSSSMISSVKTPQCLHITPGMLRSVNRDNNDKYIYHLQKVKKQGSPKQNKITSVSLVRKTKKRCVAEDDNFVVWNMLSDQDGPSMRGEEEEEEDDYFMDEY